MAVKELQYQIDRILNESTIRRKALILITTMSLLITFIVPYMAIKPGVAETADGSYEFYWDESNKLVNTGNFFTSEGDIINVESHNETLKNLQYNGISFSKGALKLNSKGSLNFTPETTGTLVVVHAPRNDDNNKGAKIKITVNGSSNELTPDSSHVSTYQVETIDKYTIDQVTGSGESHLFYAKFTPDDSSTEDDEEEIIDTSKYYTIKNAVSGRYISYSSTPYTNGNIYSDFKQVTDASGNSCKFKFEDAGDGYYYIQVFDDLGNNYYLEAYFKDANNRYLKATTKEEDNENQKFKVIVNSDGTLYKIMNNSGRAIDANTNADNTNVNIYASGDNYIKNQQFIFEETTYTPSETPVVTTTAATTAPTTVTTTVTATADINKVYEIEVENGKADYQLAVDDNNKLIQNAGEEKNHFKFESSGEDGYYLIKNLETGKYLTLTETNPKQGDSIMLEDYNYLNDLERQKFKLVVDSVNDEMVNFVSKYEYQTDIPLVINASNSTGDSQNKVTMYRENDTNHPENKRFNLKESTYTPPSATIDPTTFERIKENGVDTNNYTLKFPQDADKIYIYVDLKGGTYANGGIGQNVTINGTTYWVNLEWETNESKYVEIDLNEAVLTASVGSNVITDGNILNAIKEAILNKPFGEDYGEAQIWWYDAGTNPEITDAYIMNNLAQNDTPTYTPIEEGNVRIEARVIFGDYNDDDDPTHNYSELNPTPQFQLYYRNDSSTGNKVGDIVSSNVVIDSSNARKDWCYQYNYYWDVAPIEGSADKSGYYVELVGNKTTINGIPVIEINGKQYYVYYLRDDRLGHPGLNDVIKEYEGAQNADNSGRAEYPVKPEHSFRNDSGAIYIYLDPLEDWQWGTYGKNTLDISMKKRWDGHNAGGVDIRPKEKIRVQLQRWDGSKWVEYTGENFESTPYKSIIYYEKNNITNNFVDERFTYNGKALVANNVPENERLKRVVPEKGEVAWQTVNGDFINKTVLEYAVGDKERAEGETAVPKDYRLELVLDYNEWNNVILSYDKGNKPSHFQKGYYMNWKALPYGQYRVIETASFYDANDNDVLDAGDRDTSSEYYYMSFPPSRDSKGVLHIQNFTKDMVIELQKEWYDDQGKTKIDKDQKTVSFNVYRSTAMLKNPTVEALGDPIYEDVITDENGHLVMKTTDGYPELKLKDENDRKYYYYIQEVSVDNVGDNDYTLKNGNSEDFVRSTNGNYYIEYEGGDARKFFIQNKVKVGITLNKEWYTDKNSNSKMIFAEGSEPNAEFEVYKGSYMGTPTKTGEDYFVNNTKLEKIADAKIDKNGQLEIVGGDINDGNGTSKVMSNQLHIFGTSQTYDGTTKGVFENDGSNPLEQPKEDNDKYYYFPGSSGKKRLWIKPTAFAGELVLTFQNVEEGDKILIHNNAAPNDDYAFDLYALKSGTENEVEVSQILKPNGNYRLTKESGEPKLKSAVFYPYNYYYIREKNSDTCELINGDSSGFVKNGDGTYYTQITAANRTPTVTAKNTPKNTELDINKEWYSTETDDKLLTLSKSATFEIYKGYQQGKPIKDDYNYKVNSETLQKVGEYTTDTAGKLNVTNLPAYEEDADGKYKKVYYYVREVDGNYKLITESATNGFIADGAGNYGSFFDENDISTTEKARTYTFKNVLQLKLQVEKTWVQDNNTVNEVKIHLYRSTDLDVANNERSGMKISAPTAQTSLDETDTASSTTLSAGLYRAGTLNRMLAKLENDESITTLGQAISNEEVPVIYNAVNTLTDDNIDSYYVETLTIKRTDNWKYTKTMPVYDDSGNLYYYWVVEDANCAAGYNVDYSSSDDDSNTTNCINADNHGGGIIKVINSLDVIVILPETGGSGTHGYTAAGSAVVLFSAVVLMLKRRKKKI